MNANRCKQKYIKKKVYEALLSMINILCNFSSNVLTVRKKDAVCNLLENKDKIRVLDSRRTEFPEIMHMLEHE
jgi:hypothetical protein